MKRFKTHPTHPSILVDSFRDFIGFANKHFTLSKYLIKGDHDLFFRIEIMMLSIIGLSILALSTLHYMPHWLLIVVSILFIQRIVEFFIVYSRNFIFNEGRVFTHFEDANRQGQWLLMMFSVNMIQMIIIFSIWYRSVSILNEGAFSQVLGVSDAVYFSMITFLTVGYGDIIPVSELARALVMFQSALTFYTVVIVINGLISIHFIKK